jgi:hypothetical protein
MAFATHWVSRVICPRRFPASVITQFDCLAKVMQENSGQDKITVQAAVMVTGLPRHAGDRKRVFQQTPQIHVMQTLGRGSLGESGATNGILNEHGVQQAADPGVSDALDEAVQFLEHLVHASFGTGEEM